MFQTTWICIYVMYMWCLEIPGILRFSGLFQKLGKHNESYWSFSSLGGFTGVHLKYQKQLHSASWFVLARLSGTVSHYWLFWLMGLLLRWRSHPNISLQDSKHYEQETLAGSSRISTTEFPESTAHQLFIISVMDWQTFPFLHGWISYHHLVFQ